jgi:23S rRNA pseudouridine1911/1915/1917 synthase
LHFTRQALHAEKLALVHPVSKLTLSWRAELPTDMRELIAVLRARNS